MKNFLEKFYKKCFYGYIIFWMIIGYMIGWVVVKMIFMIWGGK